MSIITTDDNTVMESNAQSDELALEEDLSPEYLAELERKRAMVKRCRNPFIRIMTDKNKNNKMLQSILFKCSEFQNTNFQTLFLTNLNIYIPNELIQILMSYVGYSVFNKPLSYESMLFLSQIPMIIDDLVITQHNSNNNSNNNGSSSSSVNYNNIRVPMKNISAYTLDGDIIDYPHMREVIAMIYGMINLEIDLQFPLSNDWADMGKDEICYNWIFNNINHIFGLKDKQAFIDLIGHLNNENNGKNSTKNGKNVAKTFEKCEFLWYCVICLYFVTFRERRDKKFRLLHCVRRYEPCMKNIIENIGNNGSINGSHSNESYEGSIDQLCRLLAQWTKDIWNDMDKNGEIKGNGENYPMFLWCDDGNGHSSVEFANKMKENIATLC